MPLRRRLVVVALCLVAAWAMPATAASALDTGQARDIAADAYVYAYPLVLMDVARRVQTNVQSPDTSFGSGAPLNRFTRMSRAADPLLHGLPYPDIDTLWSLLWFDVSKEPLLVEVPDARGRYYSLTLADMWSDVFAAPGSRTAQDGLRVYAIVAPDWHGKLPKPAELLRAPTSAGLLRLRVAYRGISDLSAAQGFQTAVEATPLSRWGKKTVPADGHFDVALSRRPAVEQVAEMKPQEFFSTFAELAARYPPHDGDGPMLQRMARLGLAPGQHFELSRLPADIRAAVEAGVLRGQASVRSPIQPRPQGGDAWRMPQRRLGSYGTDYPLRARTARVQIATPLPEDEIVLRASADSDGRPLDGSFRYEVRFDRGQLPPADALWSMTLYNDRRELFDNPINLYAVGTRHPLTPAADGTWTVYVQYAQPAGEQVRNWLPAPQSGRFTLMLRLYQPREDAAEGLWTPPAIRRIQ
ncbi:hypothetical protein AKI39_23845 [Bordetella sp. H567]|uniref:DUF1254 domain-containing protein n=1 Tax=Bordetella sp. H567 TaxID=1697043 RepID=UPI00081C9618|nr:DUF1214 domain-containing protein [Bordetella sp. H567]AOB33134.1 hypothetical protein AKI39_23845 [Bordetella sp. H567]